MTKSSPCVGSRLGRVAFLQEDVQRGVAPADAVLVGQLLEPAEVLLGDGRRRFPGSPGRSSRRGSRAAAARGRCRGCPSGTGRSRRSPPAGRTAGRRRAGRRLRGWLRNRVWPYSLKRQQRPLATQTGPAAATSRSTSAYSRSTAWRCSGVMFPFYETPAGGSGVLRLTFRACSTTL